jgi:hypothetical protein
MRYAIARILAAGALMLCVATAAGPAGAQEATGEPPATAEGQQQIPAPVPLPPGILLAPQTTLPPGAQPRGPVQSCPDQGQRLELIV